MRRRRSNALIVAWHAIATMFVGFYWGGWSLGSTADKMAKERSDQAVVARPIERFGQIVAHAIVGGLHHRYTRI
jgi:hypothetical protein